MDREKETRTDALIRKVKDHPVLAPVIAGAIVLTAVAVFIVQLDDVRKVLWPTQNPATEVASTPPRFSLEAARETVENVLSADNVNFHKPVFWPNQRGNGHVTVEFVLNASDACVLDYRSRIVMTGNGNPGTDFEIDVQPIVPVADLDPAQFGTNEMKSPDGGTLLKIVRMFTAGGKRSVRNTTVRTSGTAAGNGGMVALDDEANIPASTPEHAERITSALKDLTKACIDR